MATVNDYRVLGTILPPSEKVSASEVADILSAAIAVSTYGQEILDAAQAGAQAVVDLYHNKIAEKAAAEGHDAPVKGAPVYADSTGRAVYAAAPGDQVTRAEFARLMELVQSIGAAVAANGQQQQAPPPAQQPAQEPQQAAPAAPGPFRAPPAVEPAPPAVEPPSAPSAPETGA